MRKPRSPDHKPDTRNGRRWSLAALCLLAAAFVCAGCATAKRAPALNAEQTQLNVESFDYVWTTIRDKYWDPDFGGLDWPAVRDELRPKVEQADSMSAARGVMSEMVNRLGVSHFSVIPGAIYEEIDLPAGSGARDGDAGIDVRIIDGQVLVTSIVDGSPAAEAGVRPGWVITHIGEEDLASKLEAVAEEFAGQRYKDYILVHVAKHRLTGRVGETVTVRFLDGDDHTVALDLPLAEKKGRRVQLGHLPPIYVWIDVDRLDGNIGYIAFNHFLDPPHVMPVFNDAIKSFMDADGIVIDVRGNGGGLGAMVVGMVGWLIPEKGRHLGTIHLRDNELKLVVYPRLKQYDGPVAVLIDGLSVSAAEFLAGGLKDLHRAGIVGTRTPGAALPSAIEKLPNGDGFQYVFANYVSAGGEVLEGVGVVPDIEAAPTRQALLEGRDPVLEAAIAWIRRQKESAAVTRTVDSFE